MLLSYLYNLPLQLYYFFPIFAIEKPPYISVKNYFNFAALTCHIKMIMKKISRKMQNILDTLENIMYTMINEKERSGCKT